MLYLVCRSLLALTLSSLVTFTLHAADSNAVVVKVELSPIGSFEATAKHVYGKGEKVGTKFSAKEIKVLVNQLSTGMSLRDKHLKETLKAKEHKYILARNIKAENGTGEAEITISGVTKPVKFKYKENNAKDATAVFKLNLKDFGIKGVSYQGVGVQDSVEVSATVPYEQKK